MEELITVQKYASKYRLSIHNVIKKTMSGELATVEKEENSKKVTYIVLNPETTHEPAPSADASPTLHEDEIDYQKAYEDLHKEYLVLKTKYEKLLAASSLPRE
ncbi:MAG: hypothetical protein JXK04_07980 [Campylobacterales bacterium]|nr:hypothetical protein [Campylobacterales bacterium]